MVREGLIYNDTVHVVFIFSGTGTVIVTSFDTDIPYYLLERLSEYLKQGDETRIKVWKGHLK